MDFFERYLSYREATESPKIFHRWTALSGIGAVLERNYYMQHGPFRISANLYVILMGDSGARKSSAIKLFKPIVSKTGYDSFAAEKSSQAQFLIDLQTGFDDSKQDSFSQPNGYKYKSPAQDPTDLDLWGNEDGNKEPKVVYAMASEFAEFMGTGNAEFCTALGDLWDWHDEDNPYRNRFKNAGKIRIWQPTINILGAITSDQFASTFPPTIIGQGFFSRLLLIYGERRAKKDPTIPDPSMTAEVVGELKAIRQMQGMATVKKPAKDLLFTIYEKGRELEDTRFKSYNSRRDTHLRKLCLVVSAARQSTEITEEDVIKANTFLSAAERLMPKALGEFGKARNSDTMNKIVELLDKTNKPLTMLELYRNFVRDIEKPAQLAEMLNGLALAGKIQSTKLGWLPIKKVSEKVEFVDWNLLSSEERENL